MRRLMFSAAVLGLLAALTAGAAAASDGAAPHRGEHGGVTFSLYAVPDPAGEAFLPADPGAAPPDGEEGAPSVGDEFVFTDVLFELADSAQPSGTYPTTTDGTTTTTDGTTTTTEGTTTTTDGTTTTTTPTPTGDPVGVNHGRCMVAQLFLDGDQEDATIVCSGVVRLTGRGDIAWQGAGRFSEFEDPGFVRIAITGGTGEFRDAGGEVTVRELRDDDPDNDEEEIVPSVYEVHLLHLSRAHHCC